MACLCAPVCTFPNPASMVPCGWGQPGSGGTVYTTEMDKLRKLGLDVLCCWLSRLPVMEKMLIMQIKLNSVWCLLCLLQNGVRFQYLKTTSRVRRERSFTSQWTRVLMSVGWCFIYRNKNCESETKTSVRITLIIKLLFIIWFCDPTVGDRIIKTEGGCGKK